MIRGLGGGTSSSLQRARSHPHDRAVPARLASTLEPPEAHSTRSQPSLALVKRKGSNFSLRQSKSPSIHPKAVTRVQKSPLENPRRAPSLSAEMLAKNKQMALERLYGTYKPVKARSWPWFSGESPSNQLPMRRAAHPSGCARCSAGAGCSAIKYQPLLQNC